MTHSAEMISIPKAILTECLSYVQNQLPLEACGYLAGENGAIVNFFPMTNTRLSPIEFAFDPSEQFETVRLVRSFGLELLAVVHSHPSGTATPSAKDIELADPNLLQIIVIPDSEPLQIKAFQIVNSIVKEIAIEFVAQIECH